mmetsp:Transcript_79517/g.221253  ORF Transcript_79517/g.221253 Transcript_79517/m.221253 type:complete len:206 (+) Transcript_79517:229-846(+)
MSQPFPAKEIFSPLSISTATDDEDADAENASISGVRSHMTEPSMIEPYSAARVAVHDLLSRPQASRIFLCKCCCECPSCVAMPLARLVCSAISRASSVLNLAPSPNNNPSLRQNVTARRKMIDKDLSPQASSASAQFSARRLSERTPCVHWRFVRGPTTIAELLVAKMFCVISGCSFERRLKTRAAPRRKETKASSSHMSNTLSE